MEIAAMFDAVANQMRADFAHARQGLQHRGLRGDAYEDGFRAFLRDYLPGALDVSTGELVDAAGNVSRQLDVIIHDAAKTPILYRNRADKLRVIPVECAYAVIEVKAQLDGTELARTFENMLSVRRLKKTAFAPKGSRSPARFKAYGKEWDIWPVLYFIFAYDSIDLNTLASQMAARHHNESLPEHSRLDTVCVLDKGVICNLWADGTYRALPEPGSRLSVSQTKRALLLFYTLLSNELCKANLPNFQFREYLGSMRF